MVKGVEECVYMKILENVYVLGFLMVIAEILINIALHTVGDLSIGGVVVGFVFGSIYTHRTRKRISGLGSFKAAAVYTILVGVFGALAFLPTIINQAGANSELGGVLSIAAAILLLLGGLATWFALYFSSMVTNRSLKKQEERNEKKI